MTPGMNRRVLAALPVLSLLTACGSVERDGAATTATLENASSLQIVLRGESVADVLARGGSREDALRRRDELELQHERVRAELARVGAELTGEFRVLTNAMQVRATEAQARAASAWSDVLRIDVTPIYERSLLSAVPAVGAPKVWQRATPLTGSGVRIAVIDSGLDYLHADFGGPGTTAAYDANDRTLIEPGSFPTAKVIGGYDFVGDDYDAQSTTSAARRPDPDPLDCNQGGFGSGGHGTHVAGIAAGQGVTASGATFTGPYTQSLNPSDFRVGPGVAPDALLYSFKVFGCQGATDAVAFGLERAGDPNDDGDPSDRVDVVNLSLGSSYALGNALEDQAYANLAALGTVVVVAAGNDGDATYSVGSPATAAPVIAVAASVDSLFVSVSIDTPAAIQGQLAAVEASFGKSLSAVGALTGTVVAAEPSDGCSTLTNAGAVAGHVALLDRGNCEFGAKIARAADAGAIAVLVANNQAGAPFQMGGGAALDIPAVMIAQVDGVRIRGQLAQGVTLTFDGNARYTGPGTDTIASFSSRGPALGSIRLKPEIAAPGQEIDSARVGSGTNAVTEQGTSMASPMVAGAAALTVQAHPAFSPAEIKAVLMNSAAAMTDTAGNPYTAAIAGAGRVDLERAVDLQVTAAVDGPDGSVGISFGNQVVAAPTDVERVVRLKNHGAVDVTYTVSADASYPITGAAVEVEPGSITVAAGAEATVKLTLHLDPAALPARAADAVTPALNFGNGAQARHFLTDAGGLLKFADGTGKTALSLPYLAIVRAAGHVVASAPGCAGADASGDLVLALTGDTASQSTITSVFVLGTEDERLPASETDPDTAQSDIVAVGAATDYATKGAADASVFFGVAVAGQWGTPAVGPIALLGVEVDSNLDDFPDFRIDVEAVTRDGPHGDVLVAVTYDALGEPTESRRYVNGFPADQLDSLPFDNQVLVLPAFVRDLALPAGSTKIRYRAIAPVSQLFSALDETAWSEIDLAHPGIDATLHGVQGRPSFDSASELRLGLEPGLLPLPDLLVLHHGNVAGERHQIVKLTGENLILSASELPAAIARGSAAHWTLTVTAEGADPRGDVSLGLSALGARVVALTPSTGTCTLGSAPTCSVPSLAPGTPVTIDATIEAGEPGTATLTATTTAPGCESVTADDQVTANFTIPAEKRPAPLAARGGCDCAVRRAASPLGAPTSLLALLALALRAAGRRRGAVSLDRPRTRL